MTGHHLSHGSRFPQVVKDRSDTRMQGALSSICLCKQQSVAESLRTVVGPSTNSQAGGSVQCPVVDLDLLLSCWTQHENAEVVSLRTWTTTCRRSQTLLSRKQTKRASQATEVFRPCSEPWQIIDESAISSATYCWHLPICAPTARYSKPDCLVQNSPEPA